MKRHLLTWALIVGVVGCTAGHRQVVPETSVSTDVLLGRLHRLATLDMPITESEVRQILRVDTVPNPRFAGRTIIEARWLGDNVPGTVGTALESGTERRGSEFAVRLNFRSGGPCVRMEDLEHVFGRGRLVPPPLHISDRDAEFPYFSVVFPVGRYADGYRQIGARFEYRRCARGVALGSGMPGRPYSFPRPEP